jgi:hypothetical protein
MEVVEGTGKERKDGIRRLKTRMPNKRRRNLTLWGSYNWNQKEQPKDEWRDKEEWL